MPTTSDYIEEYFNHKLSTEEQRDFEEKLKSDKDFAKEVEEQALLINAFDEMQAQELLRRFGKIEEELEGGKVKQFGFPVYLRWAAAIAVLAVVSLVVYLNSNNSGKELFLAYYIPYPNVESPVSRSEAEGNAVWQSYERGDYKAAYQQFDRALEIDAADLASQFYLGICALELNKLKVAEKAFTTVAAVKNATYAEQAEWYLALSYLKEGKRKKARGSLEEIIATNSSYTGKAKSLLGELE